MTIHSVAISLKTKVFHYWNKNVNDTKKLINKKIGCSSTNRRHRLQNKNIQRSVALVIIAFMEKPNAAKNKGQNSTCHTVTNNINQDGM
jgi:hypothetical protein